jgi:hypothetical protein
MSTLNQNNIYSWIGFLFVPFAMFLYALKHFFNKNSQLLILAFSFLYGYSVFLESGDITRYETTFYDVASYTWGDYYYLLTNFMSLNKELYYTVNTAISKPDLYSLSLNFIITRFTDNPRWFWAFVSLIYTAFAINFINAIAAETNWIKNLFSQRMFFIGLVLIVPFYYGITGVRFWPALFLFATYALKFLHSKKIKYLLIASLSILFHYTFLLPIILLIITIFIPNNRFFYRILILISLLIFSISSVSTSLGAVKNATTVFEETAIEESSSAYTDEEALIVRKERGLQTNWYVQFKNVSVFYFFLILGILDVFGVLRLKENNFLKATYPLLVAFLVLTLLTYGLGSIARFRFIYYILILSRFVILAGIQPFDNKLKFASFVLAPILILYTLVVFRAGFYTVDPLLLVNNSILTFFMHSDVSLSELLIGH